MKIEGAGDLHQALYAAIEAQDAAAFNALVGEHFSEIEAEFGAWMTVPAAIRADQAAVSRYIQSLVTIARTFNAIGEPALLQRLTGSGDDNPIVRWERRLGQAQALSEAGEYAASDRHLEAILAEMAGATGAAVDNLRPKVYGSLGFNALHEADYAAAVRYTAQAYDACAAAGDEEGRVTYYDNLMSLTAIQTLETEPARGERLLDVRRIIARAQDSADAGRYQASSELLSQALARVEGQDRDPLFQALRPKIHGLLGSNAYKLGDATAAHAHTAAALAAAEAAGDADGVRIYTANLAAIEDRDAEEAA